MCSKCCCQRDIAYGVFKDLPRRTTSKNTQCSKAFNIAKNPKSDGYQISLANLVYKFYNKECDTYTGTGINCNSDSENQQFAEVNDS